MDVFNPVLLPNNQIEQDRLRSERDEVRDANQRIEALERKLDKMQLLTEALWQITKQANGLNQDLLQQVMEEVELQLAIRAKEKISCPKCKRSLPKVKQNCFYCGAKLSS